MRATEIRQASSGAAYGRRAPPDRRSRASRRSAIHALDDAELSRERARGCFRSSGGEVLLYLEENGDLRFHALSPHMTSAVRSECFVPMINAWIDDLPLADAKKNMQDRQIEFA